ncbi:hypothetical protein QTO34_012023 [Cnephaeus nilssonii]|uniref:Thymocyte nuclear protein 1 n=1 Tax=Cnephaeus nilssonii TaxID=3371016 RepID=A0AA40HBY5_CNENI|nr:hypothetical protein QTO34_012023 [Eptesicus nilssonii]
MPRPRKRLYGTAGQDKQGPAGKRTKTKNPGEAPTTVERSSPQETSALKKRGNNVSSYWLMKSEPESRLEKGVDVKFSIEDLKAQPKQTACWDGVRNYQARNFLRAMKLGQEAFSTTVTAKSQASQDLGYNPRPTQFEKRTPIMILQQERQPQMVLCADDERFILLSSEPSPSSQSLWWALTAHGPLHAEEALSSAPDPRGIRFYSEPGGKGTELAEIPAGMGKT